MLISTGRAAGDPYLTIRVVRSHTTDFIRYHRGVAHQLYIGKIVILVEFHSAARRKP